MANNLFDSLNLPPEWKKYMHQTRNIIIGVIVIIVFWTSFFQVGPEEVGVITRFGRYVREVEPGLNFKAPVIERIYKVPTVRPQKE